MFRQTHIVTCAVCKSPVAHLNTLSVRQKSWGSTRWHSCTWSLDSRKASKSKHESHNSTRNCPPHPFKPYQAKVSTKFDAETLRHKNASTVRNAQWTTTDKTGNSRDIYMTPYGDVSKPILLYFGGMNIRLTIILVGLLKVSIWNIPHGWFSTCTVPRSEV